ncbi:hypothetical protein LSUE1_G009796 [Lachnellula suecica]|uniref:Uncharacterized protein n=1 Tax=Lachnellula suecica TaxID=602035 RepID=A0A8T9BRX7_9HELO|nr:hypothetical protein LSUE1_G009796 [Lachnellula suecica]
MQFFKVFSILIVAVSAVPTLNNTAIEEATIEKRTCGSLSGTALKVCQDACVATCTVVSAGIAATLCYKACKAG